VKIAEQKNALRREMREKLLTVSEGERSAASREIVGKILSLPAWRMALTVALFAPLATEPDISGLFTAGKTICYPRVCGGELEFYHARRCEDLRVGSFGILEPGPTISAPVSPSAIDLAVIPGLAFDADGHRLGRGKGYYDRFLASTKALTVGVCFACQQVSLIPTESHDVRLNLVMTEKN
jgi:5-formyltetrahydrofolate cyclo-ligase